MESKVSIDGETKEDIINFTNEKLVDRFAENSDSYGYRSELNDELREEGL